MLKTPEIAIRRKRAGATKVRTGCITCKIRHLKCDEQKPACDRCVSTGRKCDGYASQGKARNHPVRRTTLADEESKEALALPSNTEKSLATINVTKPEHHSLDYFVNRAAPLLSSYADSSFWNRLVLQLGHSEPAIRHAIITISAAYEQMERHPMPLGIEPGTPFSLHHYNKSLNHLINYLSSNNQAAEVPLITCILFICFEYIQGDPERAVAHILSGVNIMQLWRKKDIYKGTLISKEMIDQYESVEQYLTRTFAWLRNGLSIFYPPSEFTRSEEANFVEDVYVFPCRPPRFTSMYEARMFLYNHINRAIQFMMSVLFRKYNLEILPRDETEHTWIMALLDSSYFGFQTFMQQNYLPIDTKEREALTLARIHFKCGWILTRTALAIEESAYDQYVIEFTQIVDLCETLISCTPPFSFNIGYIPALYFVACKCRDRALRRKAVGLLYKAPSRREVHFTAEQAYKVAVRTIQLEEAGMDQSSTTFPPEWSRIHYADISHGDLAQPGSGRLAGITFFSKPDGATGEWKLQTEYMDLLNGGY